MRRGLTLIELLLGLGLSSLMLTVALSLFVAGRDMFLVALDEAALAQATYLVPRDIADGLEHTELSRITYAEDQLTFATAYDSTGTFRTDETGLPDWQSLLDFWVQDGRLLRGRRPHDGRGQLVCESIRRLTIQPLSEGVLCVRLGVSYHGFRRQFQGEVSLCARPRS